MSSNHSESVKDLDLERLKEHRDEILKAEIAGLLFNLGKTHIGIHNRYWSHYSLNQDTIEKSINLYFKKYKDYLESSKHYPSIKDTNLANELSLIQNKRVFDFFENEYLDVPCLEKVKLYEIMHHLTHKKSKDNEVREILFKGCEQINSGIDKGYSVEQLEFLWVANAFGGYRHDVKIRAFDSSRRGFFKKFNQILESMKKDEENKWISICNFIKKEIKNWYSSLLSDTRFPMNDVTLWDQVYMTSSLFKAAIASKLLGNSTEDAREIKWSIMGIQYDKLALAEKALRVHFIHSYKEITREIDQALKDLIELEYALGNEIYRDETGIYFLVPEDLIDQDQNKNSEKDTSAFFALHRQVKELEQKILRQFSQHLQGETYPSIFLTKPSRGTMNLAYLLRHARKHHQECLYPEKNRINFCIKKDATGSGRGICQVCRIRLAVERHHDLLLCTICKKRFHSRVDRWLEETERRETIWTGEVQDRNGRIALVTLKFELFEWLNGNLVNTLLMNRTEWVQAVKRIAQDLKKIKTDKNTMNKTEFFKDYVDRNLRRKDLKINELCELIILERTIGDAWETLLQKLFPGKIDFSERNIYFDKFDNQDYENFAAVLLQFLLRKNPSPARLRRIWDSTQAFFEDIREQLSSVLHLPYWRCHRLVWEIESTCHSQNSRLFQYEGLDFWVSKDKVYLISSIEKAVPVLIKQQIQQLHKTEREEEIHKFYTRILALKDESKEKCSDEIKSWIKDSIEIECPDTGEKIKLCRNDVKVNLEFYKPIFSITDPSPVSWQLAVPAEHLPNLIRSVQAAYRQHFKFVTGKLPLHIGGIVQHYKRPLYVGIKALRRIRRDIQDWKDIQQEEKVSDFLEEVNKSLKGKPVEAENKFSDYSLYSVKTSRKSTESEYSFHLFPHQWDQNTLMPLSKIREDSVESVNVYPNTFDFEYLDVNTRRNDIYYKENPINGLRRVPFLKRNRPYPWSDWDRFEKFLDFFANQDKRTKLQHLAELIYGKLQDWDGQPESVKTFMLTAMVNVLEIQNDLGERDRLASILGEDAWERLQNISAEEWVNRLYQFMDMFEFWHTALKRI